VYQRLFGGVVTNNTNTITKNRVTSGEYIDNLLTTNNFTNNNVTSGRNIDNLLSTNNFTNNPKIIYWCWTYFNCISNI
ncbi:hypothetical protein, partial [Methanobrevibacter sp.]